jgi:hypothetical protein
MDFNSYWEAVELWFVYICLLGALQIPLGGESYMGAFILAYYNICFGFEQANGNYYLYSRANEAVEYGLHFIISCGLYKSLGWAGCLLFTPY